MAATHKLIMRDHARRSNNTGPGATRTLPSKRAPLESPSCAKIRAEVFGKNGSSS